MNSNVSTADWAKLLAAAIRKYQDDIFDILRKKEDDIKKYCRIQQIYQKLQEANFSEDKSESKSLMKELRELFDKFYGNRHMDSEAKDVFYAYFLVPGNFKYAGLLADFYLKQKDLGIASPRIEGSFMSKLLHTVYPNCFPIYDSRVAEIFGFSDVYHLSPSKRVEAYWERIQIIAGVYYHIINRHLLDDVFDKFDKILIPKSISPNSMSKLKKLDFMLWQLKNAILPAFPKGSSLKEVYMDICGGLLYGEDLSKSIILGTPPCFESKTELNKVITDFEAKLV